MVPMRTFDVLEGAFLERERVGFAARIASVRVCPKEIKTELERVRVYLFGGCGLHTFLFV